jgi:prephenate dehydratase
VATIVAFQGEPGAFSDGASRALLPAATTTGFGTFDEAIGAVASGDAAYAVLPVENSISGPIPRIYDLLWIHSGLTIVDELVLPIEQTLIGTAKSTIDGVSEVRSHPVALEQCRAFLATHPTWHSVIVPDTAGAVRAIVELGDPHVAAIGPAPAAERYGAKILAASIQDSNDNFTRFFLVRDREHADAQRPDRGRACVALTLEHRAGSLRDALSAFADANVNLRTLVSRPSQSAPFEYRFYCELESVRDESLATALERIGPQSRILGRY